MEPNPLLRWPNENIPICDGRRPAYDDLTQAQFVSGVLATIQDVNLPLFKKRHDQRTERNYAPVNVSGLGHCQVSICGCNDQN